MADISKITLASGTTYNFKDEAARQSAGDAASEASAALSLAQDCDSAIGELRDSVETVETTLSKVGNTYAVSNTSTKTVSPASTWINAAEVTLPAGTYVVTGCVGFDNKSNSTARGICINTAVTQDVPSCVQINAINGLRTFLSTSKIVSPTTSTKYILCAFSATTNTGISSGYATISAVRIK